MSPHRAAALACEAALLRAEEAVDGFRARASGYLRKDPNRSVLLVDDEVSLTRVFADILRQEGYIALSVGTLKEARAVLKEIRFGLVVLDMRLPDGDGWDLVDELPRDTALVVTSGMLDGDLGRVARRMGAQGVLPKPSTHRQLLETVREILGRGE